MDNEVTFYQKNKIVQEFVFPHQKHFEPAVLTMQFFRDFYNCDASQVKKRLLTYKPTVYQDFDKNILTNFLHRIPTEKIFW